VNDSVKDDMPVAEHLRKDHGTENTVEDAELIRQFKNGSESAFTALVKRYQPRLLQVATLLLKDEYDAMDMVQDVFVKVYYSLKSFREDSALYTWLYRILYNRCITHLRKKKIVSFFTIGDEEETPDIPSTTPFPDKDFENKELMKAITAAIEKLPMRQRTAFTLKQINDLKFSEIAGVMGITEGAAKASYFHAVKKLQDLLKNYGDDYGL